MNSEIAGFIPVLDIIAAIVELDSAEKKSLEDWAGVVEPFVTSKEPWEALPIKDA